MKSPLILSALALLGVFGLIQPACAGVNARLLRQPAVSGTHITFVYAGDIWIVPKEGGTAQHLSSPPGEESFPKFSPDGTHIAFTGNYDGNQDIYLIDAFGGPVTRVTHHPGMDRMLDWYPDGKTLLFASGMQSGSYRFMQLYKINASGGLPEKLPIPYAEMAAISPDSQWVAYTPTMRQGTWKRYRGGTAPTWCLKPAAGFICWISKPNSSTLSKSASSLTWRV